MKDIKFKDLFSYSRSALKKLPWFLGKYAFVAILIFIFIDIFLGLFIFYNYIYSVKMEDSKATESPATFKQDVYQRMLDNWQARAQNLESGQMPNSF